MEIKQMKNKLLDVKESSGNVFADLGLKDADDLYVKSGLVYKIAAIIKKRKLTQIKPQ